MLAKSIIVGVVAALVPFVQAAPRDPVADAAALADLVARGGGMDLVVACHQQYGSTWSIAHKGDGKYDWYCVNSSNGNTGGLDLAAYCRGRYGSGSEAKNDKGGLYDWYCT